MQPSRAILTGDPNHTNHNRHKWKSQKIPIKGPGKTWKTAFSVYAPCVHSRVAVAVSICVSFRC